MKITKYPHRYVISMTPTEFEALKLLVAREGVFEQYKAPARALALLNTARWAAPDGPLSIDVEKAGRGGSA